MYTETVLKQKHGVWDPLPELTLTSQITVCRGQSRLQHIYHGQPYARVNLNPSKDMALLWIPIYNYSYRKFIYVHIYLKTKTIERLTPSYNT
jgi:hypothetical protein